MSHKRSVSAVITTYKFFGLVGLAMLTLVVSIAFSQKSYAADYTASLSTSGSQVMKVSPRVNNLRTAISVDNINVQTTCKAGYTLSLSASVNDNNLYRDGDSSAAGAHFAPADGVNTLVNSPNTWGYIIADTRPTEDSVFNAVPSANDSAAVLKAPVTSEGDINENLSVYYGVSADDNTETGTYKMILEPEASPTKNGTLIYYLTIADACTSYTIHYDPTGADSGGTIRTGTGTVSDQIVKEGVPANLTTDTYTPPVAAGAEYHFAGWNTAQDGSGTTYANGEEVTDLAGAGETITLYAMWSDCVGGNVCYFPNAENVTDTMADQTVKNNATSIDLWPSNFQRAGYGFAGWSTRADESGTKYGPMETVDISRGQYANNGLSLYAMWVAPAITNDTVLSFRTPNLLNITLADGSGETLADKPTGYVTALKDDRDGQVYAIAKLADGKYWMIENLRLDDGPELSGDNTNNPALPLINSWYYLNHQETMTMTNYLSAPSNSFATSTAWCNTALSSDCIDQSMLDTANTEFAITNENGMTTPSDANIYSYGNYYNWYSATAGNGKYGSDYATGYVSPGDICPTGWRLPTGGSASGDFGVLDVALGGTGAYAGESAGMAMSRTYRSFPNNFIYSGAAGGSNRGEYGYYWTSTAVYNYGARSAVIFGNILNPGFAVGNKSGGNAVRCVAQ